jgi:hypothetical protein
MKATKLALVIGAALLVLAVAPVTAASASTSVTVPCSGTGGGAAGLIAAITAANGGGGGTINLAAGCNYALTTSNNGTTTGMPAPGLNGLPVVTSVITVVGSDTTIAANNTDFRIFEVDGPGGNLTLEGLTISGGNSSIGGGILNAEGAVTLDQSVVTGNTAQVGGGGIASGVVNPAHLGPIGTLTLNASHVNNNTALASGSGGGGGGGILNHAGTLTLNANSQVNDNTSDGGGGGIASGNGNGGAAGTGSSTLIVNSSEVNDNTSNGGPMAGAGGIANGGVATIVGSEVNGNHAPGASGGGILNHGSMTITSSIVDDNTVPSDAKGDSGFGGGIANANFGVVNNAPNSGVLVVTGTQIDSNTASGLGGGIFEAGANAVGPDIPGSPLTLASSQVINNVSGSGGGLYATVGSTVTLNGTLVGGDTSSVCSSDSGNAAFLCAAYGDLLGRAPDPAGSAAFEAALSNGTSRVQVAFEIATSLEYRNDFVNGLYESYLGRSATKAEISGWVNLLAGGVSDQRVLESILGSPEFYLNAGQTASGFVTALYTDVLGRAPDAAGLSFWVSQLANGVSRDTVAVGIVESPEFVAKLVGSEYLDILDRAPSADPAGISFWVSQLLDGTSFETVRADIIGSPEFFAANT